MSSKVSSSSKTMIPGYMTRIFHLHFLFVGLFGTSLCTLHPAIIIIMVLNVKQETSDNSFKIPHMEAQRQGVVYGMSLFVEFLFFPSLTKTYSHLTFQAQ